MSLTDVLREAARVLGGLCALYALLGIGFANLFQTREWEACKNALLGDVVLGFAAGGAFILLFAPNRFGGAGRAWLRIGAAATVIGILVGGMLAWAHWDAYRVQSGTSIERPADPQD